VRKFGGVLEHPEASAAWRAFGLIAPPKDGGWVTAGDFVGWTCCVEQGHYGHRARKATWLYACRVASLPSLTWGASLKEHRVDACGFHTSEERIAKLGNKSRAEWLAERGVSRERLGVSELKATPLPFRDMLLSIARDVTSKPFSAP
jgi:hypothetical protein